MIDIDLTTEFSLAAGWVWWAIRIGPWEGRLPLLGSASQPWVRSHENVTRRREGAWRRSDRAIIGAV